MNYPAFRLNLPSARNRSDILYPPKELRRSWTHSEILDIFPNSGIRILDIGAGPKPFVKREIDELTTVDFDSSSNATITADISTSWPFKSEEFDFIYMSHVLEHFYPRDRDRVIANVYFSLKEGGLLFIRVPHWSHMQATGWEHYTFYGLNGATSLCHGYNPMLPMFRAVATGVAMTIDFYSTRIATRSITEKILNYSWNLTDRVLCYLVGGIPEVQFLLQKLPKEVEISLRGSSG